MDRRRRDHPSARLAPPLLYFISAGEAARQGPERTLVQIEAAAAAGVDLIQLREKELSGGDLYALAQAAKRRLAPWPVRLLLNDRVDIALAAGLDGVHLTSQGLPPGRVRAQRAGLLIGQSCHTLAEVDCAREAGVDFCVFGPIFATPSKMGPFQGIAALSAAVARAAEMPVLALGGVTLANAGACWRGGAAGWAAIRLFQHNPAAVVAALRELSR